jgi:hypothetical protein
MQLNYLNAENAEICGDAQKRKPRMDANKR